MSPASLCLLASLLVLLTALADVVAKATVNDLAIAFAAEGKGIADAELDGNVDGTDHLDYPNESVAVTGVGRRLAPVASA